MGNVLVDTVLLLEQTCTVLYVQNEGCAGNSNPVVLSIHARGRVYIHTYIHTYERTYVRSLVRMDTFI